MVLFDHVYVDMFGELRHRSVVGLVSSHVFGVLLVEIWDSSMDSSRIRVCVTSQPWGWLSSTKVALKSHFLFHKS